MDDISIVPDMQVVTDYLLSVLLVRRQKRKYSELHTSTNQIRLKMLLET